MAKSTDAPVGDEQTEQDENAGKEYVVVHGGVGPWWAGQKLTHAHIKHLDWKRLLDLGAIAEVGTDAHHAAVRDGLPTTTPEGNPVSDPPKEPVATKESADKAAADAEKTATP